MKRMIILGLFLLTCLLENSVQAKQGIVMIITGNVEDVVTGSPIAGATISADIDVSPVQTDQNGNFKFIIMLSNPIEIKVSKQGYNTFEKILIPQERTNLAVRLHPQTSQIKIIMTNFQSNSYISGQVKGLSPTERENYKVLVYVLTNKWYIHPWAENIEERGFASIRDDGTWRIATVWRGYQAYCVAFLLTNRSTIPPPSVEVTSDSQQDLLSKIHPIAHLIIEAPKGI